MLEVQNLSVNYRGTQALNDVSFCIPVGQLVGIIGPNGAGKSTLVDRKSTRLNSSHPSRSRMPSSA